MTRRTGNKWSTERCARCEQPHSGYSGKLNAAGEEYVVCGVTNKSMRVGPELVTGRDVLYATVWMKEPEQDQQEAAT